MALIDNLECERVRLVEGSGKEPKFFVIPTGEKLDKIANIIAKTRAHKGDAAEIADDQAVMMIRDLLFGTEGADENAYDDTEDKQRVREKLHGMSTLARITYIVGRSRIISEDQCELTDDSAVELIREVLSSDEKEGAGDGSSN